MAIKLDLEKAYDRLNWLFIQDSLKDVVIPENVINLMLECITTASMSLLWNGGQINYFGPIWGIMQGDPISPYIFVMCIERLSHLINLAVNHKLWHHNKVAGVGPPFSHLLFADHIILFAKASDDQVRVIKGILDLFCNSSGQKISNNKSVFSFLEMCVYLGIDH